MGTLIQILSSAKNIKKLDLSYNSFQDKGLIQISDPINEMKMLQSINVSNNNGKSPGMSLILKALLNKNIKHLDIGNNATSDMETAYLKQILSHPNSTNFKYVSISGKLYPPSLKNSNDIVLRICPLIHLKYLSIC